MVVTTLDTIVRNVLMRKGYTLHWYIQFMVYSKDVLRQLTIDDLQVVNTETLPVNSYNAADLPAGVVEVVGVYLRIGQFLKPLVPYDAINPLNNFDSNFGITTYASENVDQNSNNTAPFGYNWNNGFWLTTHFNSYGESTGKFYGLSGGQVDNYKWVKNRNQIQLNEGLTADDIVVAWISDGQNANSATSIEVTAQDVIEAYIMWQMKENNRTYGEGEKERAKQEYVMQRKIFRARKNPLTTDVLRRIIQNASYGSPHS
jgi:hypothetical protein